MAVNDLLSKLNQLNNQNLVDIFIPSEARSVKFKRLSIKQQKDLIKSGLDGVAAGLTLNNTLNQIIKENSIENIEFNIVDRVVISAVLRINAFGGIHKLGDVDVDITHLVNSVPTLSADLQTRNQYGEELLVSLSLPNLSKDSIINDYVISHLKANQNIEVSNAISLIYLYELLKYVDEVILNNDIVNLKSYKPSEQLQILESLPANIIKDIVSFMQQFKDIETNYLKVGKDIISIDASFFAQ